MCFLLSPNLAQLASLQTCLVRRNRRALPHKARWRNARTLKGRRPSPITRVVNELTDMATGKGVCFVVFLSEALALFLSYSGGLIWLRCVHAHAGHTAGAFPF